MVEHLLPGIVILVPVQTIIRIQALACLHISTCRPSYSILANSIDYNDYSGHTLHQDTYKYFRRQPHLFDSAFQPVFK